MSLDVDMLMDRRRLKRRLSLWRAAAVIAAVVAIGALIWRTGFVPEGQRIARVTISGIILDNAGRDDDIRDLAEDDDVKAVIVHVDSPGGTTVGSETLYEALRAVAAQKPLVATMGTVAASGGYIAALAADHIVARGNTITGSIGVVFQSPEISGLLETVGVTVEEVKSSPLKAEPSGLRPMSSDVRAVQEQLVADSYDWFIGLVEDRRGLDDAGARRLGDGRVYTGRQAVEVKLIDVLGGEDEAMAWLSKERGIDRDLPVVDAPVGRDESGEGGLLGRAARAITREVIGVTGLSVDGLLVLWHP